MHTAIGVYENHDMAVEAVVKFRDAGFPMERLSILGLTEEEELDSELRLVKKSPLKTVPLGTGIAVGTTVGILTGVGLFAIPGFGVLFGAGALVGAIAGFDFGLIGGGIATVLATIGVTDDMGKKYHDLLMAGKYLVIAHGEKSEIETAKDLLHEHGTHSELSLI